MSNRVSEIAQRLNSRDISLWFADGSNDPSTANIRQRRRWFEEYLRATHVGLTPDQGMLVEYKPFEPDFFHTDVANPGMSLLMARAALTADATGKTVLAGPAEAIALGKGGVQILRTGGASSLQEDLCLNSRKPVI